MTAHDASSVGADVCEAVWEKWRAGVRAHGLGRETMGRLCTSLQDLPRGLWRTTLDAYAHLTLAEIRRLKSHGEKRVDDLGRTARRLTPSARFRPRLPIPSRSLGGGLTLKTSCLIITPIGIQERMGADVSNRLAHHETAV